MGIFSILDIIKDAAKLAEKFSNLELKKNFIEVSDFAITLQKRIEELEEKNRLLREQEDIKSRMERTPDGYFTLEGQNPNIRYCTHCWDAKQKTIQVNNDCTPGSFICPECKMSGIYDKQQNDKYHAENPPVAIVRRNNNRNLG